MQRQNTMIDLSGKFIRWLPLTFFILITKLNIVVAQYDSLFHDGFFRTFLLHLPNGYSGNEPLPLVVAMHGGFGNAINLQNQSGLSKKADEAHFIVVYPEGLRLGLLEIPSWNAGWCCGASSNQQVDDVGFINALLDTLIQRYAIDSNRIYATGMSNGGFMSYRLACEMSHRIAAIAPVAASMSMTTCNPGRPVPVIHFHSYNDESVPYLGGIGNGVSNHYNPALDSVLDAWSQNNTCATKKDTVVDDSQYTFIRWSDCECHSAIHYYITRDGGHSWPGGQQTVIGDKTSKFISANDLMWEFFKNFSLGCSTTSAKVVAAHRTIEVFPNPSSGLFYLKHPPANRLKVRVFDVTGRQLHIPLNGFQIDLSQERSGIYYLSVQLDDQIHTTTLLRF